MGALRHRKVRTTVARPSDPRPEDLVDRDFTAPAPNLVWVTDFERHEALLNRVEVRDLHCRAVAAAG